MEGVNIPSDQVGLTQTVPNGFRQKAGGIKAYRALEMGAQKWCKEHIPRNGRDPASEESQALLRQQKILIERHQSWHRGNGNATLHGKVWSNADGTFLLHNTATFLGDWFLKKEESRDKLGE